MRRNRSRRDKAKHFDGTINSKSLDLVVTLIQHLEKHGKLQPPPRFAFVLVVASVPEAILFSLLPSPSPVSLEGLYRIPGDMGEVRRTKEALNQG